MELFASLGSDLKVKLPVDPVGSLAIGDQSFVFQHAMEQAIAITGVLLGERLKALFKGQLIAPGSALISGHRAV